MDTVLDALLQNRSMGVEPARRQPSIVIDLLKAKHMRFRWTPQGSRDREQSDDVRVGETGAICHAHVAVVTGAGGRDSAV